MNETSHEITRGQGINTVYPRKWVLKEMVNVNGHASDDFETIPLQLLSFNGHSTEASTGTVWFVSGFQGPARNDAHLLSLIHRAVEKLTFNPIVDVFITPVANPNSSGRKPKENRAGTEVQNSFPRVSDYPLNEVKQGIEVKTLMRWARSIKPKVVVTFSLGSPKIRSLNLPQDVASRLGELCELPHFGFGTEPQEFNSDGLGLPRDPVEGSFGNWCQLEGISWIDITVDSTKKTFEEVRDAGWKTHIGPAMKWFLEGFRLNPPVEEPAFAVPDVIPALDMPPEFANL